MNIIYREAEKYDAEALIEFLSKAGDETDNLSFSGSTFNISPEREARFVEKYKNNKKDIMLVALCDGKVIANGAITSSRIARYSHRAELSITVLSEFWGQGIGSELMREMIAFSKEAGIEILSLDVRADNERAISLYEKFGFSKIGCYERFFKIGQNYHDAYIMNLYL